MLTSTYLLLNLLLTGSGAMIPRTGQGRCDDPVPINIRVFTEGMGSHPFIGARQSGAACFLSWEGEPAPTLAIFGPTWEAEHGHTFTSSRQAAVQYAGESPKGAEPLPGPSEAYMVFDPATLIRRVFVEYGGKVYMIVSSDRVPVTVLAESVLGTNARQAS